MRSSAQPLAADRVDRHGRLHGGSAIEMERSAATAWWTHRTNGDTTLLKAPTNDAVDRLNERAHRRRLDVGEVNPRGACLDIGSVDLYVGDEIVTRQNDREASDRPRRDGTNVSTRRASSS